MVTRRTRLIDRRHRAHGAVTDAAADIVWLGDPRARDAELSGAKASALAVATQLGLPVLPGVVLTTAGVSRRDAGTAEELRNTWQLLTDGGRVALAVRSSSTIEDGTTSSMAGMFTSVLDVTGWTELLDAIEMVLGSSGPEPMAVLLQPMVDAVLGGVMFGVDPVTGSDHLLVESVPEGPAALVSGLRSGTRHVLSRRGRLVETDERRVQRSLTFTRRRALVTAARTSERVFGGPQDIEWAFDRQGRLWLLQSRPVTASAERVPSWGPVLGPGPVAETLPDALSPLEEDLWVAPMRSGIRDALCIVGVTSRRALARSPVVLTVGGRVAADLDLLGARPQAASFLWRLDPRPPARRLGAAWRVGRLRRALPELAADVVAQIDADLAAVPPMEDLEDEELAYVLHAARRALHVLHGHEVLAGVLGLDEGRPASAAALGALSRGRARGLHDAAIIAEAPVTLALSAPGIGRVPTLPAGAATALAPIDVSELGDREALRLRARWVQELSARAAHDAGRRLRDRGMLDDVGGVRWLSLDELQHMLRGSGAPSDLSARQATKPGPPLPVAFRLASDGTPVAVAERGGRRLEGRGAGGGRGVGRVHDPQDGAAQPGSVLVVRSLEPALASALPGAAGLVAETGSVLSHLAILARELAVPTVVNVSDALERFPPGATVVVDGSTGEVTRLHEVGR